MKLGACGIYSLMNDDSPPKLHRTGVGYQAPGQPPPDFAKTKAQMRMIMKYWG